MSDEETNGMKEIYQECRRLTDEYEKMQRANIPDYRWKYEDGEPYLCAKEFDNLQRDISCFYNACLNERSTSYRKPK